MSVLERQLGQVLRWAPASKWGSERMWRSARVLEPASPWAERVWRLGLLLPSALGPESGRERM